MSVTAAAPVRGEGSRESSEFEFVGSRAPMAPPNPILLPSSPILPSSSSSSASPQITPPQRSLPPSTSSPPPFLNPPSLAPPAPSPAPPSPMPSSFLPPPPKPITQSVSVPADIAKVAVAIADSPPSPGLFSWVKGGTFLSRVVEKTKNISENVITTLDPQMKEFIRAGGDIEVVVASDKEAKVGPVREAFQAVFGQATVYGLPSRATSIAEQPVGFASGRQAALERVTSLRKAGSVRQHSVLVGVESFLYEVTEEVWLELSCLVLSDPGRGISLQAYSQPTTLDAKYVVQLRENTPEDYPKQWSGFAVTIGCVMSEQLNVPHTAWQKALTGLSREELLLPAARALAGEYRRELHARQVEEI